MKNLASTQRIGLGCMNLSHAYGSPPPETDALNLLSQAVAEGYDHFDTAALYGFGANESLIGKFVGAYREKIYLASKCGLIKGPDGKRQINGHPDSILETCHQSLQRLNVDCIDLYYLHRLDKNVPIEESVGALSRLVEAGKIRHVGLSEVSAKTLQRAHNVHPVTAVQTEYSLWTRNPEISVLDACEKLGVTFVAFSPLARGYLGVLDDTDALETGDLRRTMPRFSPDIYAKNLALLEPVKKLAEAKGVTLAQLALAWLLQTRTSLVAIPGTTNIDHMKENFAARNVSLSAKDVALLNQTINEKTVVGPRYSAAVQKEIDTEEF